MDESISLAPAYDCFTWSSSVKNLPAMWETWVRSLGQKDPLEKAMATYSSIFDPMDRTAWRAVVHEVAKSRNTTE